MSEQEEIPAGANMAQFTRFTWCDTNGIARCKIIPKQSLETVNKSGVGMCSLTCVFSADTKPANYPKLVERGFPDCFMIPQWDTFYWVPWAGSESQQVGGVLCQLHEKDENSTPCGYDSRYVCSKLVDSLKSEFGLEMYSAFEYEFVILKDKRPMFDEGTHIYSPIIFKKMEKLCFSIVDRMKIAGLTAEALNPEFGQGQFEITMKPAMGTKGPDNAFIFKQCVKETAMDHDLFATFMSCPFEGLQNGGHYNFSLWEGDKNVFHDDSDPDKLSQTAKYWIAGLLKHAPALTALICPTNNCYNRYFDGGFAPFNICYAPENRSSMIRVKNSKSTSTYLEYRSPGSAANPYLVLAGVLAAGMDGLWNKLEPPPIGFNGEKQLPRNLGDALAALEEDEAIRKALGEDMIEPFLILKKEKDLPITDEEEQYLTYFTLM